MSKKETQVTVAAKEYQILERETAHDGYFHLRKLFIKYLCYDGTWSEPHWRELLDRKNSVAVVLFDPYQEKLILIEQFRVGCLNHEPNPWVLEIVAGIIDDEKQEPAEIAAKESYEESGLTLEKILPIGKFWPSPGGSSEYVHLFVAKVDSNLCLAHAGLRHEHEDIKVFIKPVAEVFTMLEQGKIQTAPAIIGLQWLKLHYEEVKHAFLQ